MRPIYPNELYHHGIKGMRWGVRNGPPYPLNASTHASVVRSASKRRVGGRQYDPSEDTKYDPEFKTTAERDRYEKRTARIKKGVKIAAGAAALGAAGYLAYKNRAMISDKAHQLKFKAGGTKIGMKLGGKYQALKETARDPGGAFGRAATQADIKLGLARSKLKMARYKSRRDIANTAQGISDKAHQLKFKAGGTKIGMKLGGKYQALKETARDPGGAFGRAATQADIKLGLARSKLKMARYKLRRR